MPKLHQVITLTEDEKALLSQAIAAQSVKVIANEIAATLKAGDAVRKVAQGSQMTEENVAAAADDLTRKARALGNLPESKTRDQHLSEVQRALDMLTEARDMLRR